MLCRGMQADRLQHKEMGQGPRVLEKDAAGLLIVFSCLGEAMVRPDRGLLIQETDLLDDGITIEVTF
jgi:hypothetical protein